MESHPSKREKPRNTESNQKLQQRYKVLKQQLDSMIKQPRRPRTLHRSFTDSTGIVKALAELQDSPRSLMHSLQGPSRKYDLALFTPLRERRAAIESGRLKGRRLFYREEDHDHVIIEETDVRSVFCYESDDENENDDDNDGKERHYCFSSSSSSNSSFICDECMKKEVDAVEEKEEEKVVMVTSRVEDEKLSTKSAKETRWPLMVIILSLTIGVLVFAIGFVSTRFFAGYRQVGDVILVPT